MKNFRELRLWQKILEIASSVYKNRKKSSKYKFYGLSKQSRRSCASIPANIVEGYRKAGETEYNRFLNYTIGSAIEAEYQLLFFNDYNYINIADYKKTFKEVVKIKKTLLPASQEQKPGG